MATGRKRRSISNESNETNEPKTKRSKIINNNINNSLSDDDTNQFKNIMSSLMIFDWNELKEATNPQQLRKEALKKQERSKYVRRDSLSLEKAADRRRRQNRESARRTRDRTRKYITVLETHYEHVQNINCLLTKQLQILTKYCNKKLTDDEKQNLKIYPWPKPSTIPDIISDTSSPSSSSCSSSSSSANKKNKLNSLPILNLPQQQSQSIHQPLQPIFNINNINNIHNNNPLQPFQSELLQCGVSLNNQIQINTLPNGQLLINNPINSTNVNCLLIPQGIPSQITNNNILTLANMNIIPNTY